ncbi:MAG: ammonium transporter [Flavobacteriaceae bacterium]|nr:MAG: ammonium transporter [Bacteroidota bacterium]
MNLNFFLQSSIENELTIMWITIAGFLVFFMHAGFTLVEAGFTQAKNAVNIAMKNLMAISVGTIVYWFIGYSLMYGKTSNGFFRWSGFFTEAEPHDLFFQTMFAATCATIVSGAVAGRTKYSVFAIFAVIITGLIYPIAGGWEWNPDGWLNSASFMPTEFIDLAGSSIVHAVGGWAALVGAYMVGPRLGKFVKGKVEAIPGHNKTLATLGVMALWFGWFGFNGGSQLAWGGENTVTATSIVLFTNLSAAAGAVGALVTTWILYKKPDIVQTLNGALAGLVSITAGAANMNPYGAFFAGLIGGVIVVFAIEFIEKKLKIDDAIGASSVHGVVGVWGTIVIGLWGIDSKGPIGILNGGGYEQLISQIIGALAYSIWAAIFAFIFFWILNKAVGLRVTREEEVEGLDIAEHGIRAYPGKRNR